MWEAYKDDLERFIGSRLGNRVEADDLLQEIFIKIHLNLQHLQNTQSLRPWIYRIARNAVMDHYRRRLFFEDIERLGLPSEESRIDDPDLAQCMPSFINKLPETYKTALVHADVERLGQKELAKKLGISYSGAKSRVQRARRLLQSYFTECCDIVSDKYGNTVSYEPKGKCLCPMDRQG